MKTAVAWLKNCGTKQTKHDTAEYNRNIQKRPETECLFRCDESSVTNLPISCPWYLARATWSSLEGRLAPLLRWWMRVWGVRAENHWSLLSLLSTCSLCLCGLLVLREILRVVLGLCICASLRLYLVLKLWDLRKTNNCMNFRARPSRSAAWRSQRLVSKLLLESKYCPIASSKWIEWLGDFVLAAMCSGTAHCRQAACDVTSASNRPNCWCLSSNNDNAMTMRPIFYFSTSAAGVTTPFNSVIEFPILGIAQFLWLGKVTVGMKSSFPWILQNRSVKAFDFSQSSFSSL